MKKLIVLVIVGFLFVSLSGCVLRVRTKPIDFDYTSVGTTEELEEVESIISPLDKLK